jgi:hypothetical protein
LVNRLQSKSFATMFWRDASVAATVKRPMSNFHLIAASASPPNSRLLNPAKNGNQAGAETQRDRDQQKCHLGIGRRPEQ